MLTGTKESSAWHLTGIQRSLLDSAIDQDPMGLTNTPSYWSPREVQTIQGARTWGYGKMSFHAHPELGPLPVHQGSLRLLRSEIYGSQGDRSIGTNAIQIFDETGLSLSPHMSVAVYRAVNVEEYLIRGLSIVSRLPDVNVQTEQFVSENYARFLALETFSAILELGSVYCGEGIAEILSIVHGDVDSATRCINLAVQSHIARTICVRLTDMCRKIAAEYDAMASVLSMDEASDYLSTRFTGRGRLVSLTKLLLRTGSLLAEDNRNLHVVERGFNASVRSFSFLWRDAVNEARRLVDRAKDLIEPFASSQELQGVDFWALVDGMSPIVPQPLISLDAVMAVALAERGVVVNCEAENITVLRVIAGEQSLMTTSPVMLTNPGSVWVSPFRALTRQRTVLALDGRTQLLMIDERHGLGVFRGSSSELSEFLCCEPLPYAHVDILKSTMPKAFAALARDGERWNDGLQRELETLSARKVPRDGAEVNSVVTAAMESYQQNNVLAAGYVSVIFQVKRIVAAFTLGVEQGRRMGDIMYQRALLMIHPDVTKIGGRRLRDVWNNRDEIPDGLQSFVENVRLMYGGWMVYPDSGSAGVRQVRRKFVNVSTVWLGMDPLDCRVETAVSTTMRRFNR